jgi:RNA 2',3'-cyclic 3'-phosphodiesterase
VRLFVALELPPEVRGTIGALIRELKPLDEAWKWTRAENLHITLKFLGETPADQVDGIVTALKQVTFERPVELGFRGIGFFPNERRPSVLWVGIDEQTELPTLAKNIDIELESVGFAREEREFTPHLTLARSKAGRVSARMSEALAGHAELDFGIILASEFHLIRSELKSTGALYTTLVSFSCRQKTV